MSSRQGAYPEIRWKNPWLLRGVIGSDIAAAYEGEEEKLTDEFALGNYPTILRCMDTIRAENRQAMCELTGLRFRQILLMSMSHRFIMQFLIR